MSRFTHVVSRSHPAARGRDTSSGFELREGKTITYTMTSTPGPGVKLNIPNAKPGSDGVVRAELVQKFGAPDENGIPVEMHINGQLVSTGDHNCSDAERA